MKKRSIIFLSISIIAFFAIVFYATFAAVTIGADVTTNNLNITSNTYSPMVFTTVGGSSLSINITAENMANEYAGNYMASANDNLTVQLNTDGNDAMCCTYNVSWEWIEDSNPLNQYTKSNTQSNEFTLAGSTSGTAGTYNFTNQLPNYNASSRTNAIYTGAQICNRNNGVTSASVSQIWNFTNTFYNLNVNQDAFKGASFKGKVRITDVNCTKKEKISFTIFGTTYYADAGMKWEEWTNSEYNTPNVYFPDEPIGFTASQANGVCVYDNVAPHCVTSTYCNFVSINSQITANASYSIDRHSMCDQY